MSQSNETIKVGISGFGMAGSVFHAPIIASCSKTELVAINTSNPQAEHTIKETYPNVNIFQSYEDLLASNVDLIVIPTPNETHFQLAKQALEAGKNVVIDKPMTVTSKEAEELIKLANSKNLVLSVYHNRRWDTDFLTLQKVIKEDRLGNIVDAGISFNRFRDFLKDNWREKDVPGGGILYDLGPHLIDQAVCLFGMPDEVYADIRKQRPEAVVEDRFTIILFYPDKRVTLNAGMLASWQGPKILVQGTKGAYLKYGLDPQEALLKKGKTPADSPSLWGKQSSERQPKIIHPDGTQENLTAIPGDYRGYYSNIATSILEKSTPEVTGIDGLNTIKIIEAAISSSKEKKNISL
ncbi:oxidoreductase [Marinigracilibium pacificum]|uniref:Oxidoreductase n=1 Tax=Marinigracilibium pacificum TaxID=2729599 RepID=A0A848IWR7_9BACT|nr:oxidoreductase [Marinigracilibium pacificum]NMM48767.1 oxidoreductase [Marinigracilibium pacificum]